jgi:hypothetical protein
MKFLFDLNNPYYKPYKELIIDTINKGYTLNIKVTKDMRRDIRFNNKVTLYHNTITIIDDKVYGDYDHETVTGYNVRCRPLFEVDFINLDIDDEPEVTRFEGFHFNYVNIEMDRYNKLKILDEL